MEMIKVKFREWDCVLIQGYYKDRSPALWLEDENDGSAIATCSVFLLDRPVEKGQIYIKEYSENEGMTKALVDAKVVEVIREESYGPFNSKVVLCKLLIDG